MLTYINTSIKKYKYQSLIQLIELVVELYKMEINDFLNLEFNLNVVSGHKL